jgi:hypothetical protein
VAGWDDVAALALALPQTVEKSDHGHTGGRAWLVGKATFAWERPLRRGDIEALGDRVPDGPVLAVRTDGLDAKEALLAAEPDVCFTTPHFDGHPSVLVRLAAADLALLTELLSEAWLARAPARAAAAFRAEQTGG